MAAPSASRDAPAPVVVFCHGNGERADQNLHLARMFGAMGLSTLLVEYRGYGDSAGEPSQTALVADTLAFVERLAQRDDIDPARIVYYGRSLGAAVLFQVADKAPPRAMISESAFTSAVALAHETVERTVGCFERTFVCRDGLAHQAGVRGFSINHSERVAITFIPCEPFHAQLKGKIHLHEIFHGTERLLLQRGGAPIPEKGVPVGHVHRAGRVAFTYAPMNARAAAVAELERCIGHVFTDRDLLERALTTRASATARGWCATTSGWSSWATAC